MDRTVEKEKLRAKHWGMGSPVLWVHPTQPPCASTQLCPFLIVHFSPLPSLQAVIPEFFNLSKQVQFHKDRGQSLEVEEMWLHCLLHGRDGGRRAPLSVGRELWNPMHSLTRGQTASSKGIVQSWSLEIFCFSLVHGCMLMEFNAWRRYLYQLRKYKEILKNRSKQGFKARNV